MTVELVTTLGKSFLFVLATMIPILNPAASAPIFLSLTEGASARTRNALARRIAGNIFWLMAGSMLVGSYVLDFFGISLPIVRVGGGLILAAMAWRLLGATPQMADSRAAFEKNVAPGEVFDRCNTMADALVREWLRGDVPMKPGPGSGAIGFAAASARCTARQAFSIAVSSRSSLIGFTRKSRAP